MENTEQNDGLKPINSRGLGMKIFLMFTFLGPLIGTLPSALQMVFIGLPDVVGGFIFYWVMMLSGWVSGVWFAALAGILVAIWVKASLAVSRKVPHRFLLTLGSGLIGLACSYMWVLGFSGFSFDDLGTQVFSWVLSPGVFAGAVCGFIAHGISMKVTHTEVVAEPAV